MTDTPLYNTCTLQATGHLLQGEKIRVQIFEGEYRCTVAKPLLKKLTGVDHLLKLIFYPRTEPTGRVKLHLVRVASAELVEPSKLYAVGKIRYADAERAALRVYPNPKGQLKWPFTLQLEHAEHQIPVKQPVQVWGSLAGERLRVERVKVLSELPARDESYKKERRGRRD